MGIGGVVHPNEDVTSVADAVAMCFATPLSCLSTQELSDRLVVLSDARSRLDALVVDTVAAAKAADVGSLNDQRNVANHVAERSGADPSVIRADQLIATWLADFPIFADAYRKGLLTTAHVDLLRLKDNTRVHGQMIDDQPQLIGWLTACQFRDLDEIMERWLLGADPDGAEPKEQAVETGLTLKALPGGLLQVNGVLDPIMSAAFRTAIQTEAEKIRIRHKDAGVTSTVRRRQLEALMLLVTTGFHAEGRNGTKTLINITIDQHTFEETLDWLADPDENPLPDIDPTPRSGFAGRKSQLIDGTPIHPLYAVALAAKAAFRRIVYDANGRAIETSYESRSFPPWIRDLVLIATNGKSANPVCDAPFHWLQTDHIEPDSLGGKTTLANARPLSAGDNGWRGNDVGRGTWPAPEIAPPSPVVKSDAVGRSGTGRR